VSTRVDITCLYAKEVVTFRFFATNQGMAENVAEVLKVNAGQNLRDLGMLWVADSK
jgi:hypothetical protein